MHRSTLTLLDCTQIMVWVLSRATSASFQHIFWFFWVCAVCCLLFFYSNTCILCALPVCWCDCSHTTQYTTQWPSSFDYSSRDERFKEQRSFFVNMLLPRQSLLVFFDRYTIYINGYFSKRWGTIKRLPLPLSRKRSNTWCPFNNHEIHLTPRSTLSSCVKRCFATLEKVFLDHHTN